MMAVIPISPSTLMVMDVILKRIRGEAFFQIFKVTKTNNRRPRSIRNREMLRQRGKHRGRKARQMDRRSISQQGAADSIATRTHIKSMSRIYNSENQS
ncbi:uncharacterized protein [Drosophila takahashii]|uniref:uncharacterized protein isoform X3 n=1 Tax=Drosophila takahashii TaxID=29030 RepID=UPI003898E794